MRTNKTKLEKYLDLWKEFEKLLEKENLNLSSFSKEWEKFHDNEEDDYSKVYDKLKKMKKRKDGLKNIQQNTYQQMENYLTFIRKEYLKIEIFDDEDYDHWFAN